MLTKHHKFVQRQWVKGNINFNKVARRLGYKGSSIPKGINRVKSMLTDMGIAIA